ncbi:MAG: VOC family protein [Cyanobacteria bacterium P01_E01_bin.34]
MYNVQGEMIGILSVGITSCNIDELDTPTSEKTMKPVFQSASPYQDDIFALPVNDLNAASKWYCTHFGMSEVERLDQPVPKVILKRDHTSLGFAINNGDPSQEGAAIQVSHIEQLKIEFETRGTPMGNCHIDEREGKEYNVFFVIAPDGLCYYFYEPLGDS